MVLGRSCDPRQTSQIARRFDKVHAIPAGRCLEKRRRRLIRFHFPVSEHQHLIRESRGETEVMGDNHECDAVPLLDAFHRRRNLFLDNCIKGTEGFVKEDERWPRDQGAGKAGPLGLSQRDLGRLSCRHYRRQFDFGKHGRDGTGKIRCGGFH